MGLHPWSREHHEPHVRVERSSIENHPERKKIECVMPMFRQPYRSGRACAWVGIGHLLSRYYMCTMWRSRLVIWFYYVIVSLYLRWLRIWRIRAAWSSDCVGFTVWVLFFECAKGGRLDGDGSIWIGFVHPAVAPWLMKLQDPSVDGVFCDAWRRKRYLSDTSFCMLLI